VRAICAVFRGEDELLAATRAAREAGAEILDAYTPYAVHHLDAAMGLKPSRLTWACFAGGALGAGLMLWFQYWTSAVNWPINVGGKPYDSLPAFIPVTFEATILLAGLGVVAALFLVCRLGPGKTARIPVPRVTDDRFALVVRGRDPERLTELLREQGAAEIVVEEEA